MTTLAPSLLAVEMAAQKLGNPRQTWACRARSDLGDLDSARRWRGAGRGPLAPGVTANQKKRRSGCAREPGSAYATRRRLRCPCRTVGEISWCRRIAILVCLVSCSPSPKPPEVPAATKAARIDRIMERSGARRRLRPRARQLDVGHKELTDG